MKSYDLFADASGVPIIPGKYKMTKKMLIERYGKPVGAIWTTTRLGDPSILLGYGKWKRIEGYLKGVPFYDISNEEIGTNALNITEKMLPPHTHEYGNLKSSENHHHETAHMHESIGTDTHKHQPSQVAFVSVAVGNTDTKALPLQPLYQDTTLITSFQVESVHQEVTFLTGNQTGSLDNEETKIEGETEATGIKNAVISLIPKTYTVYRWLRIK